MSLVIIPSAKETELITGVVFIYDEKRHREIYLGFTVNMSYPPGRNGVTSACWYS